MNLDRVIPGSIVPPGRRGARGADRYSAPAVGISSGAVSEGEEFAQVVVGVQGVTQALLGSASLGQGMLGGFERECDR